MSVEDPGPRLAVDIGGTFTDVVLRREQGLDSTKVLTTRGAPEEGVLAGVGEVLRRTGVAPESVRLVIHGTTLATNSILERKGARTALVTTEGFRDVLAIGYESRYDQYDLGIEKPAPLVPRERRLTVPERVDVAGRVLRPLDEDAVRALVPELRRLEAQSVAIAFLHAYANPEHEQRAGALLAQALPELSFSLSSEVCPEVREYERFTTTSANAYVRPLMDRYLGRLEQRLAELGLACPVLMMTSGGGLTSLATARRFPIRLVESGPAGGAILASHIAGELGLDRVISFDMGGTTAKICVIERQQPRTAREFEVDRQARFLKGSGLPLRIPVIEMVEIGAGGGSIARVDALKRITVGPDSAGADPGPAAYARGGEQPTITDADLVLGRIDPARFAGGQMHLEPERSRAAMTRDVGEPLGLGPELAAYGVVEMVDETMANAARVHTVEQGKVVSDHALVAFGGAAPLHVGRIAEKLGIREVVVPRHAGVGSAVGFLLAPVAYEVVRSRHMRLDELDARLANALIAEMHAEAREVVEPAAAGAPLAEFRGAYMRYVGQGHEILVELPLRDLAEADAATLQEAYDGEYRRLYRRTIPGGAVEVLTWTLTLATPRGRPEAVRDTVDAAPPAPAGMRPVYDPERGASVDVPQYWRPDLVPGARLAGPAIIAEDETSTFVPARFDARIAGNGYIVMTRKAEEAP